MKRDSIDKACVFCIGVLAWVCVVLVLLGVAQAVAV
jgi:hypothetical protein